MSNYYDHWQDWFWNIFLFEIHYHLIGVLISIPILYATLVLSWKRALVIIIILLILITPYIITFSYNNLNTLLLSYGILTVPSMLIISIHLELTSRVKERQYWIDRENDRLKFVKQEFIVQERERKRIAQELHDGVIQVLLVNATIAVDLMSTFPLNHSNNEKEKLSLLESNNLNAVNEIRRICHDLIPSILSNLGLISAIRWLADKIYKEAGIKVNLSLEQPTLKLDQYEEVVIFRIVQESLNNIRRHSEATAITITTLFQEDSLVLLIEDNGKGFDMPGSVNNAGNTGTLGIIGMLERAKSIGADLEIRSQINSGTSVRLLLKKPSPNKALTVSKNDYPCQSEWSKMDLMDTKVKGK